MRFVLLAHVFEKPYYNTTYNTVKRIIVYIKYFNFTWIINKNQICR
jgi:hypothetical protein